VDERRPGRVAKGFQMSDTIRILIVEREPLFRRGLAGCLATDDELELVGAAATADEGYRLADEQLPDVVLIGTTLADAPNLVAATEFRRRYPAIATIVVAAQESDDELFAAIRAGAHAYCGQDIDEGNLIALIKRSANGDYVINEQLLDKPYVAARVLEQFRSATSSELAPTSAFAPLTDRELEILRKVSDGLTNAEIGYALGISAQTVKNHVTSILRKLAVNDRTQAVVTALKRGWLSIDEGANGTAPGANQPSMPIYRNR
jgi:DNA-binding NarL/FixJ family response regulator